MVEKITKIVVTGDTSKYERSMQNAQTVHSKTIGTIRTGWLQITAAIYATAKAYDAVKIGARAQQEAQSFANMAASHGASSDKIINDLKRTSAGTVDTITLIQKAGTAMMMGINPEKLSNLMEIARATSKMTGQTVTKSFEDISLAVGRQSKMILDNLGIIVKTGEANEKYAQTLGKASSQLTDTEKKQAFLNATIDAGNELVKRLNGETVSTAEKFQQIESRTKDLGVAISQFLIPAMSTWIDLLITAADYWGKLFSSDSGQDILKTQEKAILDRIKFLTDFTAGGVGSPFLDPEKVRETTNELARLAMQLQNVQGSISRESAGGFGSPLVAAIPGTGGDTTTADKTKNEFLEASLSQAKAYDEAMLESREAYAERDLEIIRAKIEAEKALNVEYRQYEIDQATAYDEALIQGHADTAQRRIDITANAEAQIKQIKEQSRGYQWSIAEGLATGVAAIAGAGAKEIFLITKGLAIAEAIVSAHAASAKALAEVPYPFNLAVSAKMLTLGYLQVAAIAATAFGQLAQSSSSGGGGGGLVGGGTYTSPVITAPASPESKPALTIIIEGDFIGDESYIDNLVERINGAEDRDVFIRRTLYAREVE